MSGAGRLLNAPCDTMASAEDSPEPGVVLCRSLDNAVTDRAPDGETGIDRHAAASIFAPVMNASPNAEFRHFRSASFYRVGEIGTQAGDDTGNRPRIASVPGRIAGGVGVKAV